MKELTTSVDSIRELRNRLFHTFAQVVETLIFNRMHVRWKHLLLSQVEASLIG
jgi:hypothetical protein